MPKRPAELPQRLQEAFSNTHNEVLGIHVSAQTSKYCEELVAVKLQCGLHFRVVTVRTACQQHGLVCKVCMGSTALKAMGLKAMSDLQKLLYTEVIEANPSLLALPWVHESCTVPGWPSPVDATILTTIKLQIQVDSIKHYTDADQMQRDARFNMQACAQGHCVVRVHHEQLENMIRRAHLARSLQRAVRWCQAHPGPHVILSCYCDSAYLVWNAQQLNWHVTDELAGWYVLTQNPRNRLVVFP